MDTTNANFVWGPVTFAIDNTNGVKRDLMEEWGKLTEENVIEYSKTIWKTGADMKIPVSDNTLTEEAMQKRICSVMMGKFIWNSLQKSARMSLISLKRNFSSNMLTTAELRKTVQSC